MARVVKPAGEAVRAVDVAQLGEDRSRAPRSSRPRRRTSTPSAAPSDEVAPWICEPTHSHSSGVPIHSTRLPMNMMSTTRTAPAPVLQQVAHTRLRIGKRGHGSRRRGPPRPPANGQPEESLTSHQPISIPIRPSRGRTCQTPQPGSPMSPRATRAKRYFAGLEQHPLEVGADWPPDARRARRSWRAPRGAARSSSSRTRSSSPRSSRRGSAERASECSRPPIGKAVTNASASSRSSRAICCAQRPPGGALADPREPCTPDAGDDDLQSADVLLQELPCSPPFPSGASLPPR